ncbi:flagellar export chaperone FliS [Pseudoneobacillus sp. C159]
MAFSNPYQTYQKQAITTSRPEDLTYMLYQGLVKYIRIAKSGLQNSNYEESNANNLRAQDILTELIITLNKDYPISASLHSMYDYMKQRLIEANISKNLQILEEVEGFAAELVETWSEAMKQMKVKN